MKLPRRSLAYGWAKVRLWKKEPKWLPIVLIAGAVTMFAFAFEKKEEAGGYVMWGVILVAAAYSIWERIGIREMVEDLERRLDEAQTKEEPNQAPEPTAPSGRGSS